MAINDKELLKKTIAAVYSDNRPGKESGNRPIDREFFIYLASFKYYMAIQDYMEATNSLTDMFCYNMQDDRIRYHIENTVMPYANI